MIKSVVAWSAPSAGPQGFWAGINLTAVLTGKVQALVDFIGQHLAAKERRVAGIRQHFKVPGKALLESIEVYRVRLVSPSGMLIETARRLKRGEVYEMEILPPDREPLG
jgi:hypothetical protein